MARLDARLSGPASAPVALALSGGGDSLALLHLAADWAEARGRRLLAVTVDHGLNADSAAWTRRCADMARAVGADWVGPVWTGDKPTTGLPAAARAARHALIAEAAREAGAHVILFAHTLDDIRESDRMRAEGANLGRLRDWSPSPAWPEGRGLMLLRPLLEEGRDTLRAFLTARGGGWIEDPANDDPRHHRARARRALASEAPVTPSEPATEARTVSLSPLPFGAGFVTDRAVPAAALAILLLSASGGVTPPRGDRLARLVQRLRAGEGVSAVLAGARVQTEGDRVLIAREPGERRRGGRTEAPLVLPPGRAVVWDGRVELTAETPGWRVVPAAGRLNRLSRADRLALSALPSWARGAAAVLIRDEADAPVLAGAAGAARFLAPRRALLALTARGFRVQPPLSDGETTQEGALFDPVHGETPTTDLFSNANETSAPHDRAPEDRKPI
ncbi:tRNA lysidine(34) synthetase TilS [Brevundimonas sp. VNH65]|uniref:tRNA lysidine(34) synthetase TilS n=1 Tax=Brevundimonas sp. VNH65 TaxID=3400917 RepID=UPI003C04FBCE